MGGKRDDYCKPRCDEGCSEHASLLHERRDAAVEGEMVPREAIDIARWFAAYWAGYDKADRLQREESQARAAVATPASKRSGSSTWVAVAFYTAGFFTGIGLTLWYWQAWIASHPLIAM